MAGVFYVALYRSAREPESTLVLTFAERDEPSSVNKAA